MLNSRSSKAKALLLGSSVAAAIAGFAWYDAQAGGKAADAHAAPPSVHTGREPVIGKIPNAHSLQAATMPLDAYKGSLSDIQVIDRARSLAARACMISLGFNSWTTSIIGISKPDDTKEFDLLNYLDVAAAAKTGYPDTSVDKGDPATGRGQERHASPEEVASFTGSGRLTSAKGKSITPSGASIPEGGCLGDADRRIKSVGGELPVDPREIAPDAMFAARDDSRVQAAFKTWSECIAKAGMRYSNPLDAQIDPRWGQRTASTPAGALEKETAEADARCRQETNLVALYKTVEAAYQQRLVDQNKPELERAAEIFRQWVATAQDINFKN